MISQDLELCKRYLSDELTEDDKERLKEYEIRYQLVKWLYLDHRNKNNPNPKEELISFSFSPGPDFMKTSIFDMVKALVELDRQVNEGEVVPTFPDTGRDKRSIEDI